MMDTMQWLEKLVGFDTTSSQSNLALIAALQAWFDEHAVAYRLTYNDDRQKANLVATVPAADGGTQGGIVLSGHTDVVPVAGQDWQTDPFKATRVGDRVYGRGTCDMKGFLAVILALVPTLKQQALQQPVHMAFSFDEEVGCLGAPLLLEDLKQQGIKPKACLVGEPTNMRPVTAHKGINVFRCRVTGKAAHSSLTPQACNAIEHAAGLIVKLRELAEHLRQQGEQGADFDVPFTSLSTNMIQGGNAMNTVPASCEFFFEFRQLPGVDPKKIRADIQSYIDYEILPVMQEEFADATIELDSLAAVPGMQSDEAHAWTHWMRSLTSEQAVLKVAYATEGGQFQQAGIPTVICGPGSIEQAHRANEYVELAQLEQCKQLLLKLLLAE